ncbi:MAG: hypothetical protein O6941_05995 [Planctomycetota bacterium]|nr:hypothetical protein [Planctomycetota bacterium]MCZ6494381.1 hypothetical protein [Planctomycetota bacterium]MCZ6543541.1 hypothetical protein [Planctomycetota bacterium]MCZ6612167.1 hypothetical protein [Planctomycetota bacterium]MCZ6735401.1 hypothetical protein [Planctomycetota bacterium]
MTTNRIATACCALGMLTYVGLSSVLSGPDSAATPSGDPLEVIEFTGNVGDSHDRTHPQGHPDLEQRPEHGFAWSSANTATTISEDDKPVFTGDGATVATQWRASDRR